MTRFAPLFLLGLLAACGDLTRVPAPPVPLSALETSQASAGGAGPMTTPAAAVRLVRAAPPGALLTLHLPDIGGTIRRFKGTSLYEFFCSPEFEDAFGPVTAQLAPFGAGGMAAAGPGGIDPGKFLAALQGEALLSIQDVRIPEDGTPPSVDLLLGLTVRGAEREAEMLTEFVGAMAATDRNVKVEKGTVGGTGFTRIVGKVPVEYVVEMAVYGDALLVGIGREMVTSAVERLETAGAESMADDPSYARAMERCGDPKDAFRVHVDVQGALAKFKHLLPRQADEIVSVLGAENIRAIAGAIRIEGKDLVISSLIDSPGGRDIFTSLLSTHSVNREFLGHVPADASSFSVFPLDGAALLQHLRTTLSASSRKTLEDALDGMREAGLDFERDVFEVFGPRCALVTVPRLRAGEEGLAAILGRFLSVAFLVEVQDSVRAGKLLGRLPKEASGVRRSERTIEGVRTVSYRFDDGQLPVDFALCYALVDGYLVVALSEPTLESMLKPRDPDTAERYRDILGDVPETVSVLSYEDMRQGFGVMMELMVAGFLHGMASSTGRPVPRVAFAHLTQDFNPAVSYTISDERGTYTWTRSPTGGLGSVGGISGLFVIASIALPNLAMARVQANETAAIETLRAIGSAQSSFRANHTRDSDGDREGEYGFLQELMGEPRPGERRIVHLKPLLSGLDRDRTGTFRRQGYYFRAYLPAEDGSPIGEHEGAERAALVDGDLSESVMVVVAWPVNRSTSGRRAFLLDASGNLHACSEGPYGGETIPQPDVLCSQPGNLASAPLGPSENSRDGYRWTRLRE